MNQKNTSDFLRRLTNGNCCGRCSRPLVPENSSRAIRPLCCFLPPHFGGYL